MNLTESSNTNSTLIKNIHDFLKNGEKQIKYSPDKDIVLLLGNTGSGKSTLTHYISGNDGKLFSREDGEDTGVYVIVDEQNKISGNSTIVSQTIYPDLVLDAKNNTLYYDCPGFSDTRSAAHEIAATYFTKKVIDAAKSVKMVFVASEHSVMRGADRQSFLLMLQHAVDFIKQVEKFKNSIALIVTKVENRFKGKDLVPDVKVVDSIGRYLEQVKRDISEKPEMITSHDKTSHTKEKVMFLLDIFLSKKENGQYTKIGIFRKPNDAGPISDIELMRNGKISLENLINKNIQFAELGDKDFGYTVSPKSKVHIIDLAEEINKTRVKELLNIGKEVEEYWIAQEETISDPDYLASRFQNLQESFTKLQEDAIENKITPEYFIKEIDKYIKYYKTNVSDAHIKALEREGDYISFLSLVSNQSIKSNVSSSFAVGLSELTHYLKESFSFYSILDEMYQRLSEYDVQKNRQNYNNIQVVDLNDFFLSPIFKDIETLFKKISIIKTMELNKPKLTLFNRVLEETLKDKIELSSPEVDKIVVKGINVKLSDLKEELETKDIKFLEIYALHKVFIDSTLDLTGKEIQIAIVAPKWEVVQTPKIILDGKPGIDYRPKKAKNGSYAGESGSNGQPGEPGGPAGNFIGIGKHFINEEHLSISANGGNGGRGQDGGDGAEGSDGTKCSSCKPNDGKVLITFFYNTGDAEFAGNRGGDGGHGGAGGFGGQKGFIHIINVGKKSQVVKIKQIAQNGNDGGDGKGGNGGMGGRYFKLKIRNYVGLVHQETFEPMNKWGIRGASGQDGSIVWSRKDTWKLTKFININYVKTNSAQYLRNNKNKVLKSALVTSFLSEIDNHKMTARKRRHIKQSDMKLRSINKPNNDQTDIYPQSYVQYVNNKRENYLDIYDHFNNSSGINKPASQNNHSEREYIQQITPSKVTFPMSAQLENCKNEKSVDIKDPNSSINLYGNLLLSEIFLKKFFRRESALNNDYKHGSEKMISSAHDLAYRHYLPLKNIK